MVRNKFIAGTRGIRSRIYRIVRESDLVIEVLDARDPEGTRNEELERLVARLGKTLGMVINKTDLARNKRTPGVCTISSKYRNSKRILMDFIREKLKKTQSKVAIVGYPNVGKSTIINMLTGRKSASVAPVPGHTRGVQWLRLDEGIMLLDSPGIVPRNERDEASMAKKGAIEADQLRNPEYAAHAIIEDILIKKPSILAKAYGIKVSNDAQEILESVAIRRGRLLKGGAPDTLSAAKLIVRDHYKGRI